MLFLLSREAVRALMNRGWGEVEQALEALDLPMYALAASFHFLELGVMTRKCTKRHLCESEGERGPSHSRQLFM